ncbi:MAG: hypothetical protein WKF35_02735 [Ferruginibacter sp.]
MKFACTLIAFVFISFVSIAQSSSQRKELNVKEDTLKGYSFKIIRGINASERLKADSLFTKAFVRALKIPYSFNYHFDSLQTISQLYAPDSSFRIFTWQMVVNENVIRQHGAIQMKTANGSLKLFPLIDKSDITQKMTDTIGNNLGWMGAVYYKIITTKHANHTYYTLLGYDENNIRTDKKIIEILDFKDGKPVFGGQYFNTADNSQNLKSNARYVMEFKKQTSPRLTFDPELNMIIMEHLMSPSNEPNKKYTLIPDGDYEGFKWENGKWNYIAKVFNEITPENQPPTPKLIRDAEGNIDESKLAGAEEEVKPAPKKVKPPKKKD